MFESGFQSYIPIELSILVVGIFLEATSSLTSSTTSTITTMSGLTHNNKISKKESSPLPESN